MNVVNMLHTNPELPPEEKQVANQGKDFTSDQSAGKEAGMRNDPQLSVPEISLAIFETAVEAIVIIDCDRIIRSFNPSAEKLFGYSATEVVGQPVNMLMPEPHQAKHDDYVDNYIQTGEAKIIGVGRDILGLKKDGIVFPLHLAVSEALVGETRFFVGFLRDLTEMRALQNALVSQSERERAEIGQDLHDVLAQQLTALTLLTKALQTRLEKEGSAHVSAAHDIEELSRTAMEEARRLSHGLFPTELEKYGFIAGLEELTRNVSKLWNTRCRLITELEEAPMDKHKALHLYRIAQEAASNAVKHGAAPKIDIYVRRGESGIELEIQDHGKGFPKDLDTTLGMGTLIMKHRASLIGASLSIVSEPGEGVRVSCQCTE